MPSLALSVFCSEAVPTYSTHSQNTKFISLSQHLKNFYINSKIMHKIKMVILWNFFQIIILSVVAMAVLFLLTKLMGFRQISEMSFFDYVIGITIGSIAAEMSTNIDLEWWKGITAMAVWTVIGVLLSVITQKSITARHFISGEPIIIMQKGKIIKKNMKKAKLDIDDLIASARASGYFSLFCGDIDSRNYRKPRETSALCRLHLKDRLTQRISTLRR